MAGQSRTIRRAQVQLGPITFEAGIAVLQVIHRLFGRNTNPPFGFRVIRTVRMCDF